ncbi:transposase [Telluribacter humicola]|uniref:transposase n=1 Tax=Telluribacter humicola TaxID=1720261 RepID=UPI00286E0F9C|nr:transposase [Telluribacter humicola]
MTRAADRSDRQLVEHCSMRMDILYFLGYDIDEALPWHSTLSRTRQFYPATLFEALFNKVFALCVEAGMVAGHTQAIDRGGKGQCLHGEPGPEKAFPIHRAPSARSRRSKPTRWKKR